MKDQVKRAALAAVGAGDVVVEKARAMAEKGRTLGERRRRDASSLLGDLAERGDRVVRKVRGSARPEPGDGQRQSAARPKEKKAS